MYTHEGCVECKTHRFDARGHHMVGFTTCQDDMFHFLCVECDIEDEYPLPEDQQRFESFHDIINLLIHFHPVEEIYGAPNWQMTLQPSASESTDTTTEQPSQQTQHQPPAKKWSILRRVRESQWRLSNFTESVRTAAWAFTETMKDSTQR